MKLYYETDRLLLKVLNESDALNVLNFYIQNNEFFSPYEPARLHNFYTLAFWEAALHYEYQQILKSKALRYYVYKKDNPSDIIGTVCFSNITRGAFLSCQLGYKLHHNYIGHGYATESILNCIDIAFREYCLHRIEAYIMPSNQPSIRLIEALGFMFEGIATSYANINGRWEDHLQYSLLNKE